MASIKLKGDTSGEVTILAPSVAENNTLTLPSTSSTLATQNSLGVRNLIINGDMRIAQRGTSVSGITNDGYYTSDRFYVVNVSAGTWTQTQDTDVPSGQGFVSSLKMQCTTADASLSASDQLRLEQRIEAQNLQHLKFGTANAESLTLSFWVKSNKTGTYTVWLYALDDARSISKTYTIDTADTWEKKTITIEGDSVAVIDNDNAIGLFCTFSLGAGSNYTSGTFNTSWNNHVTANMISPSQVNLADSTSNYINITGVQLEVGTEATPFEHRPYDMELARCQRYFQWAAGSGNALNTTQGLIGIKFLTEMRANPTATLINGTNALQEYFISGRSITSINHNATNKNGGGIGVVSSGMTANRFLFLSQGNGYISFSAEL
jgi:hypothetical protein